MTKGGQGFKPPPECLRYRTSKTIASGQSSNHLTSIMFRGYVKTLGGYFKLKMTITVPQRFEIIDFIFSDPSGVPKATPLAVVSKIQQKKCMLCVGSRYGLSADVRYFEISKSLIASM